ncbi:MAG: hypothetical protein ABI743_14730 [bacterium]
MPTSTFWNQVRLITPSLEPLLTLFQGQTWEQMVWWPVEWTGGWAMETAIPDRVRAVETPQLAVVRTPLPHRLAVWTSGSHPGTLFLAQEAVASEGEGLPDDRIAASAIEVLAGSGVSRCTLLGNGWLTGPEPAGSLVGVRDHINWSKDNILLGYPVEDDTPSRFIDTQTLHHPPPSLPSVIALYGSPPAMQTPAEWGVARQLGAEVVTDGAIPLALLAHFKRMETRVVLRIRGSLNDGQLIARSGEWEGGWLS